MQIMEKTSAWKFYISISDLLSKKTHQIKSNNKLYWWFSKIINGYIDRNKKDKIGSE